MELVYESLDFKPFAFIPESHLEEKLFEVLSKYIKKKTSENTQDRVVD